jgi:hypothetical protein
MLCRIDVRLLNLIRSTGRRLKLELESTLDARVMLKVVMMLIDGAGPLIHARIVRLPR